MKIIIDADSCPKNVMEIIKKYALAFKIDAVAVSSFNHNITGIQHLMVGSDSQAADLAIINNTQAQDVIITQDWGLAAMVLAKGARCIGPTGREYLPERIDFMLEERFMKSKARARGGKTKGPKARTTKDDRRFEENFKRIIFEIRKELFDK